MNSAVSGNESLRSLQTACSVPVVTQSKSHWDL